MKNLKKIINKAILICVPLCLMLGLAGCGSTASQTTAAAGETEVLAETETERTAYDCIRDIIICYGYYKDDAAEKIEELFAELEELDPDRAETWRNIYDYWKYANDEMAVNMGIVPDGLPEDDSLCLVVLGYALMPDGTMKPELEGRLNTVLESANKYPNAYIVCTGGGTASKNKNVTEAGQMTEWLIEKGIEPERIITEDNSLTTGQNAMFSYEILREEYPQVSSIAIVSSDYHIPWGSVLFQAECILGDEGNEVQSVAVVSNGAYEAHNTENYPFYYQAAGLLEIIGDSETAYEIYYGTFKAPEM